MAHCVMRAIYRRVVQEMVYESKFSEDESSSFQEEN